MDAVAAGGRYLVVVLEVGRPAFSECHVDASHCDDGAEAVVGRADFLFGSVVVRV